MRPEDEIRKLLEQLKKKRENEDPYSELKNIALHAAKQALEWVLEEKETPLTF